MTHAILFIGIQATGKSTFYRQRFFDTRVRINLDMLHTRHRETLLLEACIGGQTAFVVDNTNLTPEHRARYIGPAREAGFRVSGYYFRSKVSDAIQRNAERDRVVPELGILGAAGQLTLPTFDEGFDDLYYVWIDGDTFVIEEWDDDV